MGCEDGREALRHLLFVFFSFHSIEFLHLLSNPLTVRLHLVEGRTESEGELERVSEHTHVL